MTTAIKLAANRVADFELHASRLGEPLHAAQAHQAHIQGRITALTDARQAITARRAAGHHHADDGAVLALITADLDGLAVLAAEAAAAVAIAAGPADQANQGLAQARFHLAQAEDDAEDAAITAHTTKLEQLLIEAAGHADAIAKRRGKSFSTWCPTQVLNQTIRKRGLQSGQWC